jgi:hypothetical protein
MRYTIILLLFSCSLFGQNRSANKPLVDQINWLDFLTIKINHYVERYQRNEINVISWNYYGEKRMRIHSILKSNYEKEKQIDTAFILSETQLSIINKFGRDFKNNQIKTLDTVYAGTRTFYSLTLNDSTAKLDNKKSGYSLILDILKN